MSKPETISIRNSLSNIATGFALGFGMPNLMMALSHLSAAQLTISGYAEHVPKYAVMEHGFYMYVALQALRGLMYLAIAATALLGIVAAQVAREHTSE